MDILEGSAIPRLEVPASEDAMQMSPDMDRHLSVDEDIDIDLDLDAEPPYDHEDDDMEGQDSSATEAQIYSDQQVELVNDDDMFDEEGEEGKMEDRTSLIDEDLDDADNQISESSLRAFREIPQAHDPLKDVPYEDLQVQNGPNIQRFDALDHFRHSDENFGGEKVKSPGEEQAEDILGSPGHVLQEQDWQTSPQAPQLTVDIFPPEHNDDIDQKDTLDHQDDLDELEDDAVGHAELPTTGIVEEQATATDAPALQDSEDLNFTKLDDDPDCPQDTQINGEPQPPTSSVHPVVVIYQDNEMSLFPSVDQATEQSQTYFLEHQSVAGESISSLLHQCRSVLADSIGEQDELEIKIAELGLNIDESAAESLEITLEQILEIYLHLSHNDGLEKPDPLYMELCVKTRCSHRLEYLFNAVAEDKGLSDLEFPYISEDLNDEAGSVYEDGEANDGQIANENKSPNSEAGETVKRIEEIPSETVDYGSNELPGIPRELGANLEGQDRRSSNLDTERVGNTVPDPEANVITKTADNKAKQDGTFETDIDDIEPPTVLRPKLKGEAAVEDADTIDYSEDEFLYGESSAGSSTLQGDIIDTKVSAVKALTPAPDSLHANNVDTEEQASDNLTHPESDQRPWEETVLHGNQNTISHDHDEVRALDQDAAAFTGGSFYDGDDLAPEDVGEVDVFQAEDTFDESEIQDQLEHTQSTALKNDEANQEDTQYHGTSDEPPVDTSSYDTDFAPTQTNDPNIERSSINVQGLFKATDGAEVLTKESNGNNSDPEKDGDEAIVAGAKSHTDQPLPSSVGSNSPHLALDDDEITYNEDEAEQPDPIQEPALSPRSLKRARSSLEGGIETNESSPDIKRIRSS